MLTSPHYGHAHGTSTLMLPTLSKGVVVSLDEPACVALIRETIERRVGRFGSPGAQGCSARDDEVDVSASNSCIRSSEPCSGNFDNDFEASATPTASRGQRLSHAMKWKPCSV